MAAISARSSCDDRPDNGWAAPKTRRPRIGLADGAGDSAEKHGLGLELGLEDILKTDLRWWCGSVEARTQRDPSYPPTTPISTAMGLRPTLSAYDISPIFIYQPLTAHVRGECASPQPQGCGHTIAHLLLQWSRLHMLPRPRTGPWDTELLEAAQNSLVGDWEPPPSYDDSARDSPPPYTLCHTSVQLPPPPEPRLGGIDPLKRTVLVLTHPMTAPRPNFGAPADYRQVAGKKKKNQKKGGDQDPWGGSGDEGKKDEGMDEKSNGGNAGDGAAGGAGAGAGAGGGGDDGDGGAGDGGGDDEWNIGKKKKKGKKNKAAIEEEEEKRMEEERKVKEQEEEEERKKKDEEEATSTGGLPAWPDGGDADPGLEWEGFTKAEKKGKKGKKGKAEEEERKKKEEEEKKRKEEEAAEAEAAPTADPLSWADLDHADTGGGWGGFAIAEKKGKKGKKGNEDGEEKKKTEEGAATTANPLSWAEDGHVDADVAWGKMTTNDKKGKKGKKSKFEPDPPPAGSAAFDTIDLGDTPQLDINFGAGGALNKTDPKMDFFDFGTSWNTPNMLDTYGADAPNTDITDTFNSTAMDEGGAWGFSETKKKKKQTPISGFGLGKIDPYEPLEQQSKLNDTKEEGNGFWDGAVPSAGKKDKKGKKKGGTDDTSKEPAATVPDSAVTDSLNNAEDAFTPFATAMNKKDRKKAKKNSLDASISELPPVAQPTSPTEPPVEEEWGSFPTIKDKKKGKKGAIAEPEKQEEPSIDVGGDPGIDFTSGWGFPKKDKKKGKKTGEEELMVPETVAAVVVPQAEPEIEQEKESSWVFGGKNSKKAKKATEEDSISFGEKPPPIISDPAFEEGGGWGFGSKKDKKKGKKIVPEEPEQKEPVVAEFLEPDQSADIAWNSLGTKKDKKKGKKDAVEEMTPLEDLNTFDVSEAAPIVEETFPSFGRKKDKKNKKGAPEVKEDPATVVDSTAAAAAASNIVADNTWMDWGITDKKKDKKGSKGIEKNETEEASTPLPPPPAVSEIPEPYSFGNWGSSKKEKKGKNAKTAGVEPPLISVPDPITNFLADDNEGDWGTPWSFSGRDKKKKEEQEQEQREREMREEEERLEAEKEEEKQMAEKEKDKEKEKEKSRPGKKGKVNATAAASKAKDVAIESNADAVPSLEGDSWGTFGASKAKDKKKGGRKDAVQDPPPPAPTPPAQGLTPEPTPEPFAGTVPDFDDYDNNNSWGSVAPPKAKGKKDGKKAGKVGEVKADSKASKDETGDVSFDFLQDNDQDEWSKNLLGEETSAKAAKSLWSVGAGLTAKSKLAKEKEKDKAAAEAKKAEEAAQDLIDLDEKLERLDDDDPLMDLIDEPAPKSFKSKAGIKLNSTATKESDKSSKFGDNKKKKGGWNVGGDSWGGGGGVAVTTAAAEIAADPKPVDDDQMNDDGTNTTGKADGWSFWGATKKTTTIGNSGYSGHSGLSGKLVDEPKKEITKHGLTNQSDSLNPHRFSSKAPEPSWLDDQAEPPKSSKPAKPSMSSTKPVAKPSAVAARVKALEKEKDKGKTPEPAPTPPVKGFEPLANAQLPPKKPVATGKLKSASASKNAPWEKKDLLSLSAEESKETADFLPGSFPDEGAEDDDIVDVVTLPPGKKSSTKNANAKKAPAMDPVDLMDLEDVPEFEIPSGPGISAKSRPSPPPPAPEAPPTPPPEPVASKPAKKERARVVRDEGASSWGFWAAAPKKAVKKEVRAKDDADLPSPSSKEKPGLARSKTTKVGKEKETEKSSGKSSGSDKEKKPEPRASKSRGASFGGLFGGPPPARARPIRRPSVATPKNASRRQSMDIDALGLPSPPADDAPEMSSKAAKLMGTNSGKLGRKESVRGKPKVSAVPDPYPIDDDDMVMVNGLEDPVINAPIPKARGTKDRSSKTRAGQEANQTPDLADDVVMVEGGPSNDGTGSPVAKDDLAFTVERPKPLQRSSTNVKRPGNSKLMGLFGGFQKSRRTSEAYERTRSKNMGDDDEGYPARKRTATGEDDGAKRIRRDDRRIRRSERPDVTINGLVIDPVRHDEGVRLESGNSESKREERRAKRASRAVSPNEIKDADILDGQDRRARRREPERTRDDGQEKVRSSRDQKVRKEEDQDAVRREEKRTKRAAREDYAPQDLGFDIPEKRSKHRERDLPEASTRDPEPSSRPHRSDRRRSRTGHPLSPSGEAERRPHRSRRTTGERSSHRKTAAPAAAAAAAADYLEPHNSPSPQVLQPDLPPLTQENHEPYMHGANDHTSSWVKSQISEPAPPPPVEPSVLDPAPVVGPVDDEAEQEARRAARRRERRRSKYIEDDDVDRRRHRRPGREGMRSSEGSNGDGDRPERDRRGRGFAGAAGTGIGMGLGGNAGGRRGSWFKKIGL